jgi:peptidoglycan/xylan/chitin deacetylase (PgdA/CDA1 family)
VSSRLQTLLYHRVEPPRTGRPDLAPDLVSASPDLFERHLRHLARYYSPVGADEVLAAVNGRHGLPSRAVLVTFDDGYRDFGDFAWPLLKQYGIPCVLFVSTAYATDPARLFWWDALWQMVSRSREQRLRLLATDALPLVSEDARWRAYVIAAEWLKRQSEALRRETLMRLPSDLGVQPSLTYGPAVLSWKELQVLARDGLSVAPHSRTHELLDQVEPGTLRCEVSGARDDVTRQMGSCPPLFAYPNGNFNARAVGALTEAGYQAAFTTVGGLDQLPVRQPLLLRREQARGSLSRLAAKLNPFVAAWRSARKPLRTTT